jgi:hypothetical protein
MTKRQLAFSTLFAALVVTGWVNASAPAAQAVFEEPGPALRSTVDLARGLRWELHWGRVAAYDLATNRPVRSIDLPGAVLSAAAASAMPDMILDRSGALIVSSNITPRLWRISPARFETEVYDIEVDGFADRDIGFTTLLWGANGRDLYGTSDAAARVWRINLAAGTASQVTSP